MPDIVDTFLVVDDEGNEYRLVVYQDTIASRTRSGVRYAGGLKSVKTADGLPVERIDNETYQLRDTGRLLRKP